MLPLHWRAVISWLRFLRRALDAKREELMALFEAP